MSDPAAELAFQNEIIAHLTAHGWLLGNTADYDRQRALYPEDVIGYVKDTQPEAWEKFTKLHPQATEEALLALVARQLEKVDTRCATTPPSRPCWEISRKPSKRPSLPAAMPTRNS